MPGVQKPHCRPCISRKPSCSACSVPPGSAMPSMVSIEAPSACTANMVQDFTDLPSRSTVQAPQWLVSQPICEPVRPRSSRRKWISRVRGSTSPSTGWPLTVMDTWVLAICSSFSSARARLGALESAQSITPAILVRYSAGPRLSEAAPVIASAAATARATVAASSVDPARMFAASSANSGVSATLVSPIDRPARPPSIVSTTAAAAVA